jgi:hypothetical protein
MAAFFMAAIGHARNASHSHALLRFKRPDAARLQRAYAIIFRDRINRFVCGRGLFAFVEKEEVFVIAGNEQEQRARIDEGCGRIRAGKLGEAKLVGIIFGPAGGRLIESGVVAESAHIAALKYQIDCPMSFLLPASKYCVHQSQMAMHVSDYGYVHKRPRRGWAHHIYRRQK